jgi:hypothetical protein
MSGTNWLSNSSRFTELGGLPCESCDISAGAAQALDNTRSDRIAHIAEHHGNSSGGDLGCFGSRRSEASNDHIGIVLDQLGCKLAKGFELPVSGAHIENQVFAFFVSKFLKSFFYERRIVCASQSQVGDAVRSRRLL